MRIIFLVLAGYFFATIIRELSKIELVYWQTRLLETEQKKRRNDTAWLEPQVLISRPWLGSHSSKLIEVLFLLSYECRLTHPNGQWLYRTQLF